VWSRLSWRQVCIGDVVLVRGVRVFLKTSVTFGDNLFCRFVTQPCFVV
jgi:hypothetical protein